jgi:ribonuclease Z
MVPLPGRYLTSLMVRWQGHGFLVDCGEGTQVAIRSAGLGFKQIDVICLTHFHADHIAGLPGLLLTIGNSGRTEPLTILGPRHVREVVDSLLVIAPQLPFPVICRELPKQGGEVFSLGALRIRAQPVPHWVSCFAYRFDLSRGAKFDAERAKALNLPVRYWRLLQNGEAVDYGGRHIPPEAVLGGPRRGVSLCYATDMRPGGGLPAFASGSDLFICEGMYGDPALLDKAVEHRHCLFAEAAEMAKKAGAGELWLTHFSPSMPDPEQFLPVAAAIFPNVRIDRDEAVLAFPEEN